MPSDRRPRIKPRFRLVVHSEDHVELRSGVWNPSSFVLEDSSTAGHLYRILRSLDGTRTPKEIAAAEHIPRAEVESVIDHLTALDVIETTSASAIDEYVTACVPTLRRPDIGLASPARVVLLGDAVHRARIDALLRGSLQNVRVELLEEDTPAWQRLVDPDETWLHDALAFERQVERFKSWKGAFAVYVASALHPPRLRRLNRIAHHLRVPWLHGSLDGPFLFVGPTFVPNRTPCFECLEMRVLMNMRDASTYQDYKRALVDGRVSGSAWSGIAITSDILAAHVAMEALNYLVTRSSFTTGKLLSLYLPTMEFVFHDVLRVPACPGCGSVPQRDDRELHFDIRSLIE